MRCSNYDNNLRMIIVENNYASPPVLTKTTFRDDISCLYFQTSKRGLLREVISKTPKALRITLKYLILTFKNTKHIPKRQQQTANTRNFSFFQQKKQGKKTPSTLDSPFWLVEIFLTVGWNTTGPWAISASKREPGELSWSQDVEVVILPPPLTKKNIIPVDGNQISGIQLTSWGPGWLSDYLILFTVRFIDPRWLALGFSEPSTVSGMYIFMCGTYICNILFTYTYHHLSTFRFFMIQMYTKHVGINIPVQGQQLKLEAEQLNVWRIENSFYCKIMFYHPLLL